MEGSAWVGFVEQGTHCGWVGNCVDPGNQELWVEEKNIKDKAAGG